MASSAGTASALGIVEPMAATLFGFLLFDEKLDALKEMLESQRTISDNYLERISLAFGCAVFERGKDTSYQEVFERADKIMYEEKKKIHEKDGILTDR